MEVWNQLSQAPWPVFGAQIIIKTGGEASKKLGWLRFFWKTWIGSCPILHLQKKQLVNAAQKWGCRWHQNPPNHRFAKNCSSPCLALSDRSPQSLDPPCRFAAKATRVSDSQWEGTLCTNLDAGRSWPGSCGKAAEGLESREIM